MKNKYEVRGDVTAIFCTFKGKTYETLIDTVDLSRADQFHNTWTINKHRDERYIYVSGHLGKSGDVLKNVILHRWLTDAHEDMYVDHHNHKTLDNRRSSNLRVVTFTENNQNVVHNRKNNKSGARGVCWVKRINKWLVQVRAGGQRVFHKTYPKDCFLEAVAAAKKARAEFMPMSMETDRIEVDYSEFERSDIIPSAHSNTGHKHIIKTGEIWRVVLKKMHIGRSFNSLEEALRARDKFLRGENVPPKKPRGGRVSEKKKTS